MTKHSPWLVCEKSNFWKEVLGSNYAWFCAPGLTEHWAVGRFEFIQVCGSDIKPKHQTIELRPDCMGYWGRTPLGVVRLPDYRIWLESFNAPVVHIWIEGTNWVTS